MMNALTMEDKKAMAIGAELFIKSEETRRHAKEIMRNHTWDEISAKMNPEIVDHLLRTRNYKGFGRRANEVLLTDYIIEAGKEG